MKKVIAILLLAGLAAACSPMPRLAIVGAKVTSLDGVESIKGELTMSNSGPHEVVVEEVGFVVKYKDKELGRMRLASPVVIPVGEKVVAEWALAIEDISAAGMRTLGLKALTSPESLTVDVKGRMTWGSRARKIEMKGVPISKFMGLLNSNAE